MSDDRSRLAVYSRSIVFGNGLCLNWKIAQSLFWVNIGTGYGIRTLQWYECESTMIFGLGWFDETSGEHYRVNNMQLLVVYPYVYNTL